MFSITQATTNKVKTAPKYILKLIVKMKTASMKVVTKGIQTLANLEEGADIKEEISVFICMLSLILILKILKPLKINLTRNLH